MRTRFSVRASGRIHGWFGLAAALGAMGALAVFTGLVESSMARLRLTEVPKLLVGAGVLSVLAVLLGLR